MSQTYLKIFINKNLFFLNENKLKFKRLFFKYVNNLKTLLNYTDENQFGVIYNIFLVSSEETTS